MELSPRTRRRRQIKGLTPRRTTRSWQAKGSGVGSDSGIPPSCPASPHARSRPPPVRPAPNRTDGLPHFVPLSLDAFHPVAEDVRGQLLLRTLERFPVDAARLHLDLTTLRFAGAYPDSTLVQKGWGSDRRVARQVRALQATTPDGVSLYFRPHPGGSAELPALLAALETLQGLLPPGLVVVIDSAFGRLSALAAADRQGLRFVVPLRADTGWTQSFDVDVSSLGQLEEIDQVAQRELGLPADRRTGPG